MDRRWAAPTAPSGRTRAWMMVRPRGSAYRRVRLNSSAIREGHDRAKDRLEHHVVERVQGLDHERVDHCHNQPVERDDDDGGDHPLSTTATSTSKRW